MNQISPNSQSEPTLTDFDYLKLHAKTVYTGLDKPLQIYL